MEVINRIFNVSRRWQRFGRPLLQHSQPFRRQASALHFGGGQPTTQTTQDVIDRLTETVGASATFKHASLDRTELMKLLPSSQEELPPRSMQDSYDSALIPLASSPALREKYITFMGGVRVGRLLEDLDVFAVHLCYLHISNPRQTPALPSPYTVVTAMVDRMDFDPVKTLDPNKDIRISGHLTWAGRSSMEAELSVQQLEGAEWVQKTRALFVMVARDPLNQGPAIINPLIPNTEEEKVVFHKGKLNKLSRKLNQHHSLFKQPPNETEKSLVHDLFMSMADEEEHSFESKKIAANAKLMAETKIKNLIICHPEHRNRFSKVYGGFIMRQAFETGWACAYVFSGQRAMIRHIDDIVFKRPVEIGSLLYLNSQVVYTEGSLLQISTKASMMDAVTGSLSLTNIFHFTFRTEVPLAPIIPKTYPEAMLYLDGRRHLQLVEGRRKFYGQQEEPQDD